MCVRASVVFCRFNSSYSHKLALITIHANLVIQSPFFFSIFFIIDNRGNRSPASAGPSQARANGYFRFFFIKKLAPFSSFLFLLIFYLCFIFVVSIKRFKLYFFCILILKTSFFHPKQLLQKIRLHADIPRVVLVFFSSNHNSNHCRPLVFCKRFIRLN